MSNIRYNKSKTYLLPLLSEALSLDKRFFKYIKNTYIFDDVGMYDNSIFLYHNYTNLKLPKKEYENNLINNVCFTDIIQINDIEKVFVYKFPELFKEEYNLFKEGKYSKYNSNSKNIIIDYFTDIYAGNINAIDFLMRVKQVLFKDVKLKNQIEKELKVILPHDAELTDIMNIDDETYKLEEQLKTQIAKIYSE